MELLAFSVECVCCCISYYANRLEFSCWLSGLLFPRPPLSCSHARLRACVGAFATMTMEWLSHGVLSEWRLWARLWVQRESC
jgi:hypothetical protein